MMDAEQKTALELHNHYRAKHGSQPLVWSEELAGSAKEWAKKLASDNKVIDSTNTGQGENICHSKGSSMTGKLATDSWYAEMELYDFSSSDSQPNCSRFTQMMWASSKKFGFAIEKSEDGTFYGVARYFPAGNISGEFSNNVYHLGTPFKSVNTKFPELQSGSTDETDFPKKMLYWINKIRCRHGVTGVSLDPELNAAAKCTALFYLHKHLNRPIISDSIRTNCGRSVRIDEREPNPDPKVICQGFYKGEEIFDYSYGGYSWKTAAFTQMVWKSSNKLGVGIASEDKLSIVVLLYSPAGNVDGLYRIEVNPPISSIPSPFL